jgi:hypothetical protein
MSNTSNPVRVCAVCGDDVDTYEVKGLDDKLVIVCQSPDKHTYLIDGLSGYERLQFQGAISKIRDGVAWLLKVYENHPSLNNSVNISSLVPMSLDEWEAELTAFINRWESGQNE